MLKTKDTLVCEVIEFTVLENLITSDKDALDKAKKYVGTEKLISCQTVEQYLM